MKRVRYHLSVSSMVCGPLDALLALHDEPGVLPAIADRHSQRQFPGPVIPTGTLPASRGWKMTTP